MVSYIGLDVGERRIGVARANNLAKIAEPLDPILVTDDNSTYLAIEKLIQQYDADAVVIGLPRGLDGSETGQTKVSIDFAKNLKSQLKIPVYMIDEAGTSKAADEIIGKNKNLSRDSVAASIILEDFINHIHKDELKV